MLFLLCRVNTGLCAVPLEHVVETSRPLPVEPLARAPRFVRGVAVIRGAPLPVIDAGALLGATESRAGRFVTVRTGDRQVALAVDSVLGVQTISTESLRELPPLLRDTSGETIAAMASLDAELLLVLRSARLLPESAWAAIEAEVPST